VPTPAHFLSHVVGVVLSLDRADHSPASHMMEVRLLKHRRHRHRSFVVLGP
jgi:hypothetical protein